MGRVLENIVFDAAVAAGAAHTATELIEALERALALLGFDYFRVVAAISDGEAQVLRSIVGKVNPEWESRYGEDRLAQQDPRLRRALTSSEPFFMSELVTEGEIPDGGGRMVEEARKFGIIESYVLPHRDSDNRQFAAVLIGPGCPINGVYRVAVHMLSSALLFAALRIESAAAGAMEKPDRPALTIRQLQCLEWSRRGKSSADIGKILGLSPRTIDEHCAMACMALGVRTRVQSVAIALSLGLLPYRAADIPKRRNP